jgi:hypothetical protein
VKDAVSKGVSERKMDYRKDWAEGFVIKEVEHGGK